MNDRPRQGRTKPAQSEGPVPRMPHERDESSDSQQSAPRGVMRKAHDDVVQGRVDTDRGMPMHDTYQRQKEEPESPHSPAAQRRKT